MSLPNQLEKYPKIYLKYLRRESQIEEKKVNSDIKPFKKSSFGNFQFGALPTAGPRNMDYFSPFLSLAAPK